MSLSSYPKVLALGHRFLNGLFEGEYIVEEKVDGSQISFGLHGGELFIRSKGAKINIYEPEKMFAKGVDAIKAVKDKLVEGLTYRGEYLQKPKHQTLAYDRIPENHIVIFDIEDEHGNPFNSVCKLVASSLLGFDCVPDFAINIGNMDDFNVLLEKDSYLGGQKIEGVVVKNYDKITPDGKYMVGKFVSEKFKERNGKEWKQANPSKGEIQQRIIESLQTEARYLKAVQHLRDSGELTETPTDIGALLREIHMDIETEEGDYIKEQLYKYALPKIKRGVCAGFPEWYKRHLAEKGFDDV